MKSTAVLTGILILLIYDNVQCKLVTKPTDAVIITKDSVIMKCSSNEVNDICDNINWKHYKPNSRTGDVINTRNQLKAGFKSYIAIQNTTAGNCNLMINGTTLAAGTYGCLDLSNGEESTAELIIIDPGYSTMSGCIAHCFGNRDLIMQWMKSNGDGWTRADAANSNGYQQYNLVNTNRPFMCSIKVSTFGKLYTYEWYTSIEGTTAITTQQIATTDEFLSVASNVSKRLFWEPRALSNANNECVSGNQGLSVGAIVGIAIGVAIVSSSLTLIIFIFVKRKK